VSLNGAWPTSPERGMFAFEAVTVPFPDLHLDILFRDGDVIGECPERVKIARFGVGWNGAIAFDVRADATDQAPKVSRPVEPIVALFLAFQFGRRLEIHDCLARRRQPFGDDLAPSRRLP
jgi:hypothetical protein